MLSTDRAAERIEDYVSVVLAAAPPLTDEQLSRITGLLTAGRPRDRAAVVADRLAGLDGGSAA